MYVAIHRYSRISNVYVYMYIVKCYFDDFIKLHSVYYNLHYEFSRVRMYEKP